MPKGRVTSGAKNRAAVKKHAGGDNKPEQLLSRNTKGLPHCLPQHIHAKRHEHIQCAEKGQSDMGEKRPGHGKKIELLSQMLLQAGEQAGWTKKRAPRV